MKSLKRTIQSTNKDQYFLTIPKEYSKEYNIKKGEKVIVNYDVKNRRIIIDRYEINIL